MDATNAENEQKENSEVRLFEKCCKCKGALHTKDPKLLPCLHSLCANCWISFRTAVCENQGTAPSPKAPCPSCKQEFNLFEVIDNLFVSIEEDMSPNSSTNTPMTCTGCEENEVTSYCMECIEWLCDQCVQAHRRVRMTKDHSIVDKKMVPDTNSRSNSGSAQARVLFCPEHRTEQLKLYCETCEKLTCRDCQLLNHKNHKYQFLDNASVRYVEYLKKSVVKLQEKIGHVTRAKELIRDRKVSIEKKAEEVENEIKVTTTKLIYYIQSQGKALVTDLKALCSAKKEDLEKNSRDINPLYNKLGHCMKFIQQCTQTDNAVALLHSKKLIVHQLNKISNENCAVPNPKHQVEIVFTPTVSKSALQLGHLSVDGLIYKGTRALEQNSHVKQSEDNLRRSLANLPPQQQELYMRKMLLKQKHQQQLIAVSSPTAVQNALPSYPNANVISVPQVVPHGMATRVPIHQPQQLPPRSGTIHHMAGSGNLVYQFVNQPTQTLQPGISRTITSNGNVHVPIQPAPVHHQGHQMQRQSTLPTYGQSVVSPSVSPKLVKTSPTPESKRNATGTSGHINPRLKQERKSIDLTSEQSEVKATSPTASTEDSMKFNSTIDPTTVFDDIRACVEEFSENADEKEKETSNAMETLSVSPTLNDTAETEYTGNSFPVTEQMMSQMGEDDPSDDFCAVCHNGGDLLCCDSCPKVYHLQCHIPALTVAPNGAWMCSMCTEVTPDASEDSSKIEHIGGKRKAPTGLTDYEIKMCERVLLELYCHEGSPPFHEPVSKSVPNYYKIITNPIDFSNIKSKLSRSHFNHYDSIQDFISDVKLVFSNCSTYNAANSPVGKAGQKVEEFFGDLLHKYLPSYVSDGMNHKSAGTEKHVNKRKKKPEDIVHYQA